jgi:hypothetical protein
METAQEFWISLWGKKGAKPSLTPLLSSGQVDRLDR